jgi:hypothetical protein
MSRITGDGKIGAATFPVGGIHRRIQPLVGMRAGCRHHVSAGGKADDAKLVWVNLPFGGVNAREPERPLRIFQCQRRRFRVRLRFLERHTVFQENGGDASGS